MGKFETVSTAQLIPSQDFLKESTLQFILSCFEKDELNKLPPTPFVRKDPASDKYIAIDGHNLISVYDYHGENVEVYIAESATDGLDPATKALTKRNQDLGEKYESSLGDAHNLQKQGLNSFEQLRYRYPLITG